MFEKIQKLPDSNELKSLYPINSALKDSLDSAVKGILNGLDKRKLLIVGPCSLDNSGAIFAYLEKLKLLAESVEKKLLIAARLYTAKPRSRGGYMGLVHEDNGLIKCREVFCRAVNEFKLAVADELLYPFSHDYFSDAVSYYAIGARSSQNQEHKFFASGVDSAVGFKNPLNGDLGALCDCIAVSKQKNTFFKDNYKVVSSGNAYSHGILRGYTQHNGIKKSNFNHESISCFNAECAQRGMEKIPLIIDFSHDNSGKDYVRQVQTAKLVGKNMSLPDYGGTVKGFMLESYLSEGKGDQFGYSLTDGCLSFEQTKELVLTLSSTL